MCVRLQACCVKESWQLERQHSKLITKYGKTLCRLRYYYNILYVRRIYILPSAIHTKPTTDILPADGMKVGIKCFIITYHYEWNGHMSVRHVAL